METKSLLDAMLKLVDSTPLMPSNECRGILNIWKRKGYTIYESTHYFVRQSSGIECKPMNSKNNLKRKWYFACVVDVRNNNVYVVNAVYSKYIDRLADDTPTAIRFMSAMKGVYTRIKKQEAGKRQMKINFPENINRKLLNQALLENNNTKTQNKMKQKIRLTEGDLHRIIRQCVNETLDEDFRSANNFEPHKTIYKYLKEFQNYFHIQNEGYINKIISELKYVVEENKNELSEEENLEPIQKFIDNIETICQDIKFVQDDILDLTHGRSIEYYNRYGD